MALVFKHSRDGILEISDEALLILSSFAQHGVRAPESGGLLLGRYIRGCRDIVVDKVTTPQPADVAARYGYYRDGPAHQALVDAAWKDSKGTCCLLGDWHTHPEPRPEPSDIDMHNWREMLRGDVRDGEACFFVIVGQRRIRTWEGRRTPLSIKRIYPVRTGQEAT